MAYRACCSTGASVYISDFDSQSVEIPMAAVVGTPDTNTLNDTELAFLEGVFAYRGIHGQPTEDDFRQGLEVMSAYARQVQDNPPEEGSDGASNLGIYRLSDDERLKMAAIAFMRFGVTKPTSSQWQAVYEQLLAAALGPTANCH
jgi:hypothetical protein